MGKRIALGDKHFGKQVELVLENGNKYLLKPRNACVEKALEAFLLLLKQEGFPFTPECEHIISETENSFKSAFIEHLPADSIEDVKDYFKKCGSLIFLAYIFGSTDLHYENIIASKNTPVIIDAETLFTGETETVSARLKNLTSTVMKSHLLPHWIVEGGKAKLFSGLVCDEPNQENMLCYNNKICYIYDYEDCVIEGFKAAYEFSQNNKELLKSAIDNCFKNCSFRIIVRPTEAYSKIIELSEFFEGEKKIEVVNTLLSKAYIDDVRKNRFVEMKEVFSCEVDSVLKGEIPYFSIKYNDTGLYSKNVNLFKNFLCLSACECVKKRFDFLSSEDKNAQMKIISQSISAVRPLEKKIPKKLQSDDLSQDMFNILENGYISSISSGYIMLNKTPDNNLFLQSAGFGLYSGLSGILCAYAALYKKTKNKKYLIALNSHYQPLGDYIKSIEEFSVDNYTVSLQNGIVGIIASLLHIYDLTSEKNFYLDAVLIASKIKAEISDKIDFDLMNGISGLCIILPKLPKEIAMPIAKEVLLKLCDYSPNLTGAAHGAAGVALAVAAAQFCLNSNEYDEKIIELIKFENEYFKSDNSNWQDLRDTENLSFMNGWCSGAGGIAITRKRICEYASNAEIQAICKTDIKRAEKNLLSDFIAKKDCLCCGNSARIMASSYLGINNEYLYSILCRRFKEDKLNLLHPNNTLDINYGLMQGISGVIYAISMYEDYLSGGMLL